MCVRECLCKETRDGVTRSLLVISSSITTTERLPPTCPWRLLESLIKSLLFACRQWLTRDTEAVVDAVAAAAIGSLKQAPDKDG